MDHPQSIRQYWQPQYRRRVDVWAIAGPNCCKAHSNGPLGRLDKGGRLCCDCSRRVSMAETREVLFLGHVG